MVNILNQIHSTDALGHDGFLLENFKLASINSARFLSMLINCIIHKEIWPDKILRPIFKKGKK
jgi:hypothetical protein